jgi:23S rRNA (adenine2503-C2)-methyltransferase
MTDIKDLNLAELEAVLKSWNHPVFRAKQIFSWIYKKGADDFALMNNLPQELREKLKANFDLLSLRLIRQDESGDGTEKLLFGLKDAESIEAVSIPAEGRVTGCVSTQAGCKFSCFFCASGILGFMRNLSCGEIMEEVLYLKYKTKNKALTHIVFMGTGEPLDNYDSVMKAIRLINSKEGLNIGARRITISTCGLIPGIKKLAAENLQIELSVSLHAADEQTRSRIMPVNKKHPLKELVKTCKEYIEKTNRQVTFEYILIKGMNSGLQDAQNLSKILRGMNCKVNIIPANPVSECKIEPPGKSDIIFFRDYLLKQGIHVTLRKPRGADIHAACGQLRLKYEKK